MAAMRYFCEHCGENYRNEENVGDCARCGKTVCHRCGISIELAFIAPGSFWCDLCLIAVGCGYKLKRIRYRPEEKKSFSFADRCESSEEVKRLVRNSKPGCIAWPADEEEKKKIAHWLEAAGIDLKRAFEVPPGNMPEGAGDLIFKPVYYWVLAMDLVCPPLWEVPDKCTRWQIGEEIVLKYMTTPDGK